MNPRVAAILNLLTRGFGYWYLGERTKGLAVFVGLAVIPYAIRLSVPPSLQTPLSILVELLVAVFAVDAYRIARQRRAKILARIRPAAAPSVPSAGLPAPVADEALTGFLPVYNATALALRAERPWYPMPVFEFRSWLTGLIVVNLALLLLTLFAFRNARGLRPLAYVFAVIMLLNGVGHTLATVFGRGPVPSIAIPRPAPGFYSSPFLLVAAVYLLVALGRSAPSWPLAT
jgi:hypothetical protein